MTSILLLLSSPREQASLSSRFARELTGALKTSKEEIKIAVRDLSGSPVPHIDIAYVEGRFLAAEARNPKQAKAVGLAEELVSELVLADILVIGSGMINFGVSSLLKAWFDHIIWPGVTIKYTDTGVEGLVKGKKVYIVAASGGVYSDGTMATLDFQLPYLKHLLTFIGLTDIEEIRVEGTAFGPDAVEALTAKTAETIGKLVRKAA